MRWIYILASEDGTKHVVKCTNTLFKSIYKEAEQLGDDFKVIGLYKLSTMINFLRYSLMFEIAEITGADVQYDIKKLRAICYEKKDDGYYCDHSDTIPNRYNRRQHTMAYSTPLITSFIANSLKEGLGKQKLPFEFRMPNCFCGAPCNVRKDAQGFLHYCCSRENIWDEFIIRFGPDRCDYDEEFTKDQMYRKPVASAGPVVKYGQFQKTLFTKRPVIKNEYPSKYKLVRNDIDRLVPFLEDY